MSATLRTPRSLSAASILGPTPGSSLTGLARSSVSGGRMGPAPAPPRAPTSWGAPSILGPTPGSSLTGLARSSVSGVRMDPVSATTSLEMGHAISPQAHVRTAHAPYLRHGRSLYPEPLGELRDRLRRADVPEVQRASGLRGRPHFFEDGVHLPPAPAGAFVGDYLAVDKLQHGPHVEGGPDEALGGAGPRAPGQATGRPPRG